MILRGIPDSYKRELEKEKLEKENAEPDDKAEKETSENVEADQDKDGKPKDDIENIQKLIPSRKSSRQKTERVW